MDRSSAPQRRSLERRLLLLSALPFALAGCGRESSGPPPREARAPSRSVRTAVVERTGGPGSIAVPATVHARQRAALAARIPASVVELPWREGARVAAGALVARLDDTALRSGLVAAEAAAQAADVDLARVLALLKKGASTPKEAEESRARAAATAAAVAAARDSLSYAVLRAPFAGTVASRPAQRGGCGDPGDDPHRDRRERRPGGSRHGRGSPGVWIAPRPRPHGAGRRPTRSPRGDRQGRVRLRGPGHSPLRGDARTCQRRPACARASSRGWSCRRRLRSRGSWFRAARFSSAAASTASSW